MSNMDSYEEKARAIRDAAAEVSSGKGVAEKHEEAIRAMESQRKEVERSEKIGAFQAGVREAVKQWLTENRSEVLQAIGGKE